MSLQQIISLSFIQGLTEFLPISSSGHLILMPKVFGWKDQGLLVDVAMHVGTLFAVLVYFHKDVVSMVRGGLGLLRGRIDKGGKLFLMLCLGTIPAVIVGFSLRHYGLHPRGVVVVAAMTLIYAFVMLIVDKVFPLRNGFSQVTFPRAFLFGCAQALALIPGTSRSGICLIAGRFMGFKRPDAAQFAFLLSIPAILAAATHQAFEAWQVGQTVINKDILLCVLFSALFGFMAIAFMMYWLKRSTLTVFVIYRLILGSVLVWGLVNGFL